MCITRACLTVPRVLAQGSLPICFCKHLAPLPLMPVFEFSVPVLHPLERIITCTQFQQCLSSSYFCYTYKSAVISTRVNFVTHYKIGVLGQNQASLGLLMGPGEPGCMCLCARICEQEEGRQELKIQLFFHIAMLP